MSTNTNDIVDINISTSTRKKIRIDGDDNKILELNLSDLNIVSRFSEVYPKLKELEDEVSSLDVPAEDTDAVEQIRAIGTQLKDIDGKMRELVDYLFNANVSEMCASDGSMYDPINGTVRYDHIISQLSTLYENTLNEEFKKMKARVESKASKYIKKK